MKLISSHDAVAFLSQAAPKPWAQRLLRWMAFDEGLPAYSTHGKIQPYTNVINVTGELIEKAGQLSGPKMDRAIKREFSPELAVKLIGKEPYSRVDDDPIEWDLDDDPKVVDAGFFLFSDQIDWDDGSMSFEDVQTHGDFYDIFFSNSELLGSSFEKADYEGSMLGLSFELARIEMLLPSFDLNRSAIAGSSAADRITRIGRPLKWDWEGALGNVIAVAQTPDGLPTGQGAQARIEEIISGWFMAETGNSPAASQVRQRAASVMRTLERSKSPKSS